MLLFNIFELRLCLTKQKIKLEQLVFRFVLTRYSSAPIQSNQHRAPFWEFCYQVFCQASPPQQILTAWSNWEISVKRLSQGHNDALLPVRESNHSLFPTLNHCLSPPLFSGQNIL